MNAYASFSGNVALRALWPWEPEQRAAKAQLWLTLEPLAYRSLQYGEIAVPAGFISDLASIPGAAKWYLDDDDPRILAAAIVHDYLYKNLGALPGGQVLTRQQADDILREAMLALGARPTQAALVYRMVRLFGGTHWQPNPLAA